MNFSISHTIVADNSSTGVQVHTVVTGSAAGIIDHVSAINNGTGVELDGANNNATIADSVLSNNVVIGLNVGAFGSLATATMRNVTASHNLYDGIAVEGGAPSRIAHSVATGNTAAGIQIDSGVVESYGDNDLRGNTSGSVSGTLTTVAPQ